MVTRGSQSLVGGGADGRGQLVLIGAVAIAFVLIGLVVLFNGVVFTENVGSEGAVVDAKSSGTTTFAVEQGLGEAAHTVHSNNKYDDTEGGLLESDLNTTVREANDWRRLQAGETRGVITDVTLKSVNDEGTRVIQDATSDFTDANDNTIWEPIPTGDATRVDEFVMRIEEPSSSGATMTITVDDGSSDAIGIEANAGGTVDLENVGGGPIENPGNCENIDSGADDQIIIRITDGYVAQQPGCRVALSNPGADQSIRFSGDTDQFQGTYDFVVEDELDPAASRFDGYQSSEATNSQPHLSLIAWSADYDITVAGPTVSQTLENEEVEHYG